MPQSSRNSIFIPKLVTNEITSVSVLTDTVTASGAITSLSQTSSAAVTGATGVFSGAVTSASQTSTGAIRGATLEGTTHVKANAVTYLGAAPQLHTATMKDTQGTPNSATVSASPVYYQVVGNICHIAGSVSWSEKASVTGTDSIIISLPVSANATTGAKSVFSICNSNGWSHSGGESLGFVTEAGSTPLEMKPVLMFNDGSAARAIIWNDVSSSGFFQWSGHYFI